MPKPVMLGKLRPKTPPPRKTKRLKLEFGEEIRAVDLPLPSSMQELVELVREEFETDYLDIRYNPSTVFKVEVLVISARHLPKADREGLCDAVCRAEVTPGDVFKYNGFHTTAAREKTSIAHKSLNPDFNETLTLLVDGTGDPTTHGWPQLLLTLSDWDNGDEEKIGQVRLDLAKMIAVTARTHIWQREEKILRDRLHALQAVIGMAPEVQQVREIALQRAIDYLVQVLCEWSGCVSFASVPIRFDAKR
jgi:hypothetical protein